MEASTGSRDAFAQSRRGNDRAPVADTLFGGSATWSDRSGGPRHGERAALDSVRRPPTRAACCMSDGVSGETYHPFRTRWMTSCPDRPRDRLPGRAEFHEAPGRCQSTQPRTSSRRSVMPDSLDAAPTVTAAIRGPSAAGSAARMWRKGRSEGTSPAAPADSPDFQGFVCRVLQTHGLSFKQHAARGARGRRGRSARRRRGSGA